MYYACLARTGPRFDRDVVVTFEVARLATPGWGSLELLGMSFGHC
jgi:hypothetical protein